MQLKQDSVYKASSTKPDFHLFNKSVLSAYHVPGTVRNVLECQEYFSDQVRHVCFHRVSNLVAQS